MTMVTYIYKSQWLAAYTHFLMKNGEKTAGKQHIQKTMVLKIYTETKKYPHGQQKRFAFWSVQPKPPKPSSILIPHFKALICG